MKSDPLTEIENFQRMMSDLCSQLHAPGAPPIYNRGMECDVLTAIFATILKQSKRDDSVS